MIAGSHLPKFGEGAGSPGLNILNEKEITDRLTNKKIDKRNKTLNFYDSEDEEVIRDFNSNSP